MVVTLVAAVYTGGAALANPFFWAFAGEISGAIGGATTAAITGGDIGRGMLTGTVVGGVTGGILGPPGGGASVAYNTTLSGSIETGFNLTMSAIGPTAAQIAGNVAIQSIVTSGVGAGSAVVSTMISVAVNSEVNPTERFSTTNSSQTTNASNSWGPEWLENKIPRYGNYGGPGYGDPTYQTKPVDEMDALFREHDKRWAEGQGDLGDWNISRQLRNLPPNPRKWKLPAPNTVNAIRYRTGAQSWFDLKRAYLYWRR